MVRFRLRLHSAHTRAPHPRGDGPDGRCTTQTARRCSPPAWGWSDCPHCEGGAMSVLPTRVGMVRLWILDLKPRRRAPHPRGDGPESALDFLDDIMCSPPAWGWSVIKRGIRYAPEVLPTRVGMVRFPRSEE